MLLVYNTTCKRQNIIVWYKERPWIHAAAAYCCCVATTVPIVTFTLSHTPLRGGQIATGALAVLEQVAGAQQSTEE